MSGNSQMHRSPTFEEYIQQLETQWTRPVACQNQCDPPTTCSCLRHIVHVDAIKQWWRRKTSETSEQTKLLRLLDEMPPANHRVFPLKPQRLFTGQNSGLTVFSLLLKQNRGDLMDRFHDSGIYDNYLARASDEPLRENLRRIMPRDEVEVVLNDFNKHKWQFCPMELTLHMSHSLHGTKVIPPFCHKIKMGDKGGTASIYWVAVQKDLISDERLRVTIKDSLYIDPDYGECYQMVLKSYCGDKHSVYELEKEAFSGLCSDDSIPIVRYLGCYTHDYGEGPRFAKTYNLLLECGERDLYQAWADETNVPPVRAEEIIRFWSSLFEVAKAIRHVHNLEVPRHGRNAPHRYFGWHADVKPDNVLVVRGRLKLADFGYSRFAPAAQMKDGKMPTELIHGFTETYGAPEVFRIRRADGTMSGVTQSIDTWSFGCVLSVAATWVVLGFQGVRQFEQLRQLSPYNKRDSVTYDGFHDGTQALPEVKKWHNYLRGHVRPSDTATPLVLDLVENNMLQTETSNRVEMEELCEKLQDVIEWATEKVKKLAVHSRNTDPVVLQALYNIEAKAHQETSSQRKRIPSNNPTAAMNGVETLNPPQRARATMQNHLIVQNKPLGKTPYRKEILEKELKANLVIEVDGEIPADPHNGGFTDSPTTAHPVIDHFDVPRRPIKRNPEHIPQATSDDMPNGYPLPTRSFPYHQASPIVGGLSSNSQWSSTVVADHSSLNTAAENHSPVETFSHCSPTSPMAPENSVVAFGSPSPTSPGPISIAGSHQDPMSPDSIFRFSQQSFPSTTTGKQQKQRQSSGTPQSASLAPSGTQFTEKRVYPPRCTGSNHSEEQLKLEFNPIITVSAPARRTSRNEPPRRRTTKDDATEKEVAFAAPGSDGVSQAEFYDQLPQTVLDLPYDVCAVRADVDQKCPKGKRALIKGILGREERKADKGLTQTYGHDREIIFIVDNGATMFEHWPIVVFVAETLVKRAAGLDRNGIDLKFTIDAAEHNKTGLRRDVGRKEFRTALNAAAPDNSQLNDSQTDMFNVLDEVYKNWKDSGKPPTTLLVLTDGVWANTTPNLVDHVILNLANEAMTSKHVGARSFSIQFIRFGEQCVEKLSKLDNELCTSRGIRDIVDHCSWRSTVEKMFKGSIDGQHDDYDPFERPITHRYPDLINLFRIFNENSVHEGDQSLLSLLPPTSPHRSLSRSSSRSSKHESHQPKRESMPPRQSENWKKSHNRGPFSA